LILKFYLLTKNL